MRGRLLVAAAMTAICIASATAQTAPSSPTSPEARALIERQYDAFSRDDAAGAYAEAAPQIRAMFPDPETFLGMVRRGYPPVYRHRSVEFGPSTMDGETMLQEATLVDGDGKVWKALYRLSRGPDGGWLILSCQLIEAGEAA